jgi:hypothetical protein
MSPGCQLEMILPGGFPGGIKGDGSADERWGAETARAVGGPIWAPRNSCVRVPVCVPAPVSPPMKVDQRGRNIWKAFARLNRDFEGCASDILLERVSKPRR